VTFITRADESHPQMILARARTLDGQFICLLADGSVQQFSRSRYEDMRTNLGQPDGAANGSQPFRPRDKWNVIGGWPPSLTSTLAAT
jgi:hypothetical protein